MSIKKEQYLKIIFYSINKIGIDQELLVYDEPRAIMRNKKEVNIHNPGESMTIK